MVGANIVSPVVVIIQLLGRFLLIALGLMIIFGMMGVINLAHGEFMMIGAYATVLLEEVGVPFILAIAMGGIVSGIVGGIIEITIVRRLYGRVVETLLVTWGISIILIQIVFFFFGSTQSGIGIPFGSLEVGTLSIPVYQSLVVMASIVLVGAVYYLFHGTSFGMKVRATLQNPEMAGSFGVNTSRVYFFTFILGSMMAGIAGGILAPLFSITPFLGQSFIIEAFMIVIVGGSNIFVGLITGSVFLSSVSGFLSHVSGGLASKVGLLLAAIIILRLFPEGLSGLWRQWNE